MLLKKTWIFIALGLVVVAAIVFSLVFLLGDSEGDEEGSSISVSKVSYTRVTGMRIKKDGCVIDIVRSGDAWEYRNNEDAELDQDSMEAALTMVCYLYAKEKLFDAVEDLSVYGLDEPAMQVEIDLDDGTTMTFGFGAYTSARDGVFMKHSGSDAVYVYDLDSYSILENAAKALRDLSIDIDADKFVKIEILRTSGPRVPITMEKIPEGAGVGLETWMLSSPFTAIANAQAVSLVQTFFASPRYSAFVSEEEADVYGFSDSSAYIYLEELGGKSVRILIGGRSDSGRYYCMEEGRDGVYELASGFESLLEMETPNIIPSALFPVTTEQTADVFIEMGDVSYELLEKSGGYTLNGKALTLDAAQKLYTYLSELTFSGIAGETDTSRGPEATIRLKKGGNELTYGFHRYMNDFYAVELNRSGTVSGYFKAKNLAILITVFAEAAQSPS
jgi:hypothetical protein